MPESWKVSYAAMAVMALVGLFTVVFPLCLGAVFWRRRSIKLADSVLDAKYRNGPERPEYMEPGKVYEVNLRTTKISNTFLPGHRLRLTITSSAKNFIFPNSNTKDGFDSQIRQKARITVLRGGTEASFLEVWEEL